MRTSHGFTGGEFYSSFSILTIMDLSAITQKWINANVKYMIRVFLTIGIDEAS